MKEKSPKKKKQKAKKKQKNDDLVFLDQIIKQDRRSRANEKGKKHE